MIGRRYSPYSSFSASLDSPLDALFREWHPSQDTLGREMTAALAFPFRRVGGGRTEHIQYPWKMAGAFGSSVTRSTVIRVRWTARSHVWYETASACPLVRGVSGPLVISCVGALLGSRSISSSRLTRTTGIGRWMAS